MASPPDQLKPFRHWSVNDRIWRMPPYGHHLNPSENACADRIIVERRGVVGCACRWRGLMGHIAPYGAML